MSRFDGKVVLVTGGTSGIGKATALAFARAGGKARFVRADVGREDDVRQLVEQTLARYGRLDVAFNNAGVEQAFVPMHESTVELYRQVFDTNVLGVLLSLKYEVPAMLRTGG